MPVLCGNDKWYPRTTTIDNEKFYKVLDKTINLLTTKKIKSIDIGFDYQYITLKKDIKVKKTKIYKNTTEVLVISNNTTSIELNPLNWEDIIIREDGIYEIETQGGGIYIEFEKVKK